MTKVTFVCPIYLFGILVSGDCTPSYSKINTVLLFVFFLQLSNVPTIKYTKNAAVCVRRPVSQMRPPVTPTPALTVVSVLMAWSFSTPPVWTPPPVLAHGQMARNIRVGRKCPKNAINGLYVISAQIFMLF